MIGFSHFNRAILSAVLWVVRILWFLSWNILKVKINLNSLNQNYFCRLKSGVATNEAWNADWKYPNKATIHFNFLKISLDLLQIKLHPLANRCFTSNIVVAVFSSHEYNRYHRFAAEESVLQSGGVLCPQPGNHLLDLHIITLKNSPTVYVLPKTKRNQRKQ